MPSFPLLPRRSPLCPCVVPSSLRLNPFCAAIRSCFCTPSTTWIAPVFGIVLSRDGCDMRVGACAAELFSALCSACFARCLRAAVPPVTCFLPQPPGRCQCRWQGRRRRVQGGVCCAQQSCCRACLSHRFCRLALLPKLRLLKQRQQVCAKGLCSCAPPPASFSRRSRGGRGGQAFVKFVLPAFYFGANNTTTCCP